MSEQDLEQNSPSILELVNRMEAIIEQYIADSNSLKKEDVNGSGFLGTIRSLLSGQNNFREHPIHLKFFNDMETCVQQIAAAPVENEADRLQILRAVRMVAIPRQPGWNTSQNWCLSVIGPVSQPLIHHLTAEELRPIQQAYGDAFPRRSRLPRQQEFYTAMCDQLDVPKKERH